MMGFEMKQSARRAIALLIAFALAGAGIYAMSVAFEPPPEPPPVPIPDAVPLADTIAPTATVTTTAPATTAPLAAVDVEAVQAAVGVTIDGVFGPATVAAVKDFQLANGMLPSGELDELTWLALFPDPNQQVGDPE